ncbi:MAG: ATP-binding protein, partial [Gemmatimonadetes bacterium]|nr:ATP-binding protein [Gemmatimonadota bacterium]
MSPGHVPERDAMFSYLKKLWLRLWRRPPKDRVVTYKEPIPARLPFVGRQAECAAFDRVLVGAGEMGTPVLVIGPRGMGKSALLGRFQELAEHHRELKCTCQAFQLGETDDPTSFLETLLYQTFKLT